MRFKSFKIIGKPKEKPGKSPVQGEKMAVDQIDGLENNLSSRTKDLEKTEQKLRDLAEAAKSRDARNDPSPGPHGPIGELTVEPAADAEAEPEVELVVQKLGASPPEKEKPAEDVKLVEVNAHSPTPPPAIAQATPAPVKEEPAKDDDDSLRSLFEQDEKEVNPLASLLNSLPDVSSRELLDDLQEIKDIIKETQQTN